MPDDSLRLAVLIDADNASASVIGDILSEVASLGTASVKRVYGDFTTTTCMAGAQYCSNMRSSPSSNSVIQSARMPVTARSSSTQWICCTRANWGAFAWFPVIATLRALPRASERMVFLSMVSARRRRLDPSSTPATDSFIPRYSERKRSALQRR